MARIQYETHKFKQSTLATIAQANSIITEYHQQDLTLTLRQLYYQLVARGLLDNKQKEYKRLSAVLVKARRAGLVDWNAIVDRTRATYSRTRWDNPAQILVAAVDSYHEDWWTQQPYRVEVWIEKDALAGVIAQPCHDYDAPYFPCRGYASDSEMWVSAQRLLRHQKAGQMPIILHMGDHDPSGIDMTRDIEERLWMFGVKADVKRIALNMDQVRQYNPPPNPAKVSDSRYATYVRHYGHQSWELDALDPATLRTLIEQEISSYVEGDRWVDAKEHEESNRDLIRQAAIDIQEE